MGEIMTTKEEILAALQKAFTELLPPIPSGKRPITDRMNGRKFIKNTFPFVLRSARSAKGWGEVTVRPGKTQHDYTPEQTGRIFSTLHEKSQGAGSHFRYRGITPDVVARARDIVEGKK